MTDLLSDDGLLDLRPRARPTDVAAVVAEEALRRREATVPVPDAALPAMREEPARAPAGGPGAACHLCGRAAWRTCRACAQPSCAADQWAILGLCAACAPEGRVARSHRRGEPEEENWLARPGPGGGRA